VVDPADSTKKVLFVPEHETRSDLDIDGGAGYTPNMQRSVPFSVAAADLSAYNLHTIATTVVNPSSGRTFMGLFVMRGGANINIGINTAGQIVMETGFGTPPADFTATTAVTLGPVITDSWSYWGNGGIIATQHDMSILDNPSFQLPPSGSVTYWARIAVRQLNLGAKNGYTVNTVRGLRKFLAVSR
jgi:hypothetical protein